MTTNARARLIGRLHHTTRDAREGGFTLLEVIVSFVIFAIVAGAATAAIVSALQASHGTQQRVDAASVAQSFISQTQSNPATVTPESNKQFTASVKDEEFTVTRSITFSDSGALKCSSGLSFTVKVLVAQKQSGKFLARSDTVVTC